MSGKFVFQIFLYRKKSNKYTFVKERSKYNIFYINFNKLNFY